MNIKILLLGKNGKVGCELQHTLASLGEVIALGSNELDLVDTVRVRDCIRNLKPNLIVNAAAFTNIDLAEHSPELAMTINGNAPGVIAQEAFSLRIPLIHYSTNYVFDGSKKEPYLEYDWASPVNVYGLSKLEGEKAIQTVDGVYIILRTSWVYSFHRESFVTNVLKWSQKTSTLRIVKDQISSPTWSRMLADITTQILVMGKRDFPDWFKQYKGIYHLAGRGNTSRLEWVKAILFYDKRSQKGLRVLPALTSDFPHLAPRPLYSALNCTKFFEAFSIELPAWDDMLMLAMEDYFNKSN